jgi:aminopeptidase N
MLRGIVGDAPFHAALQQLQRERRFQKIGSEHVRAALEQASGRELAPYFRAWISGTRLPTLRVTQRQEGGTLRVEVAAEGLPGPVPLEIALATAAGTRIERVTLQPSGGAFSFPIAQPGRAEINPNRELLAIVVKG